MKRFDASLKHLLDTYPRDWVAYLGRTFGAAATGPVRVVEGEVSTVSAAADKVLRVGGRQPWLFHLEVQASHNARLARQMLLYNVLLGDRHDLPVRSVVLLLRPEADRRSLTGVLSREWPRGDRYLEFQYSVVRLWQQPVEPLLSSGLGLLPLAPLADVPGERLDPVMDRIQRRVRAETTPAEGANLWTATYVLLGLQHPEGFVSRLFERVQAMEESSTYRAIVAKGVAQGKALGKVETLQEVLLDLGPEHLGSPDEATRAAVQAITDPDKLKKLTRRLLKVSTWSELLATPAPRPRRNGRKKQS